jgi:predicted Zn-dependent protease
MLDCNVLFDAYQKATAYARKCAKAQGREYTRLADFQRGLAYCSDFSALISAAEAVVGVPTLHFTRQTVETTAYTMVERKKVFTANDLPIEVVTAMKDAGKAIDAYKWLFRNMLLLVDSLVKKGIANWDGTVEDRRSASIEASVSLHAGDSEDIMHGRSALRGVDGFVLIHVTHDGGIANVESLSKRENVFTTKEATEYLRSLVA